MACRGCMPIVVTQEPVCPHVPPTAPSAPSPPTTRKPWLVVVMIGLTLKRPAAVMVRRSSRICGGR